MSSTLAVYTWSLSRESIFGLKLLAWKTKMKRAESLSSFPPFQSATMLCLVCMGSLEAYFTEGRLAHLAID